MLKTAYADPPTASPHRSTPPGTVHYDPAQDTYRLDASPSHPWIIEEELNFSIPEPSLRALAGV